MAEQEDQHGHRRGPRTAPRRGRPPTVRIGDVAAAAGVSIGTVSKALNGRPDVSEATRERVRSVAESLRFLPNAHARSLPTGRSFSVGLLTTDVYGRFSLPLLLGAENELGEGQLAVIFSDTRDDPARELRQLRALVARDVDGIVVTGRRVERRPPLDDTAGIPVVYAFTGSAEPDDCSVVPDDAGGAALAVSRLVETGRRRVAHVTGPRRHLSARVRADAARQRLGDDGLAVRGRVRFGSWSEAWGREATDRLLETCPDLDAVFCGSDQIARGVLDTLRARGRRVPDDVAVVGFDNWAAMVAGSDPALTTVDPGMDMIGRIAARHLVAMIEGRTPPAETVVPARLVVRESG